MAGGEWPVVNGGWCMVGGGWWMVIFCYFEGFSDLQYYFNGESYVNNLLIKVIEEEGFDYSYDLRLNEFGYPETVYEKLGLINSRIIRYAYMFPLP